MQKRINNIAFDLDGTLIYIMGVFEQVLGEMFSGVKVKDNRRFQIETEPELSNKDIWRVFYEVFPRYKEFDIYPDVPELMEEIYKSTGDAIHVVTSRPENFATETFQACKRVFKHIPFKLSMVNGYREKLAYLGGVDYYVEDRAKTAMQLANHGKTVFLPIRSYNRHCLEHVRIMEINGTGDLLPWAPTFYEEVF